MESLQLDAYVELNQRAEHARVSSSARRPLHISNRARGELLRHNAGLAAALRLPWGAQVARQRGARTACRAASALLPNWQARDAAILRDSWGGCKI